MRMRCLPRVLAIGALLALVEAAGAGTDAGAAGSSAVCVRGAELGAAAGSAFGAEGVASSGLDDATGAGSGTLGPDMTIAVRGDVLPGIKQMPAISPAEIAAKPPIIKRSMMRFSGGTISVS
jgi:hypothetical protein